MDKISNSEPPIYSRIIGLDSHPDTFTAAVVCGTTPASAIVQKIFDRVRMAQLKAWAQKHTTENDLIVLESLGNSFHVARVLRQIGRNVKVLESWQVGKLKEAHANNDKISAVRIAKAYLAGTAKEVWVPDLHTQERRDTFLTYQKAVKRSTQIENRISSYLSDHGIRNVSIEPTNASVIWALYSWSPIQRRILESYYNELDHARTQRGNWESIMAQSVLEDPLMLSLVRQCGVRHVTAFALCAIIGDINRFATPKALVNYVKLGPAYSDSGEEQWVGHIGKHGRRDLRSLVIQGAQAVIGTDHPIGKWGRRLMAKGKDRNLAVAAVARKMLVAIWYLMMGKWSSLEEVDQALEIKVGKIVSKIGNFKRAERKKIKAEVFDRLLKGRVYVLDPTKKYQPNNPVPA